MNRKFCRKSFKNQIMRPLHNCFEQKKLRFFSEKSFRLIRLAPDELVESEEKFLAKKIISAGLNELCRGLNRGMSF